MSKKSYCSACLLNLVQRIKFAWNGCVPSLLCLSEQDEK